MKILISDTLDAILANLPGLLPHIPDPAKLIIHVTDKQPHQGAWNQIKADAISWIPDPVAAHLPSYIFDTHSRAVEALQEALIRWAQANPPKPQPVALQDVRPGDCVRITRQSKDPATPFTQTTEGLVHSHDVREIVYPAYRYIGFRVNSADTYDFSRVNLDPRLYDITELFLIQEAAPKPLTPSDLRTLPLKSVVSLVWTPSPHRDLSNCTLLSRVERADNSWADNSWAFRLKDQGGQEYFIAEDEITKLTLIKKEHKVPC